jgi:hypothetical protein
LACAFFLRAPYIGARVAHGASAARVAHGASALGALVAHGACVAHVSSALGALVAHCSAPGALVAHGASALGALVAHCSAPGALVAHGASALGALVAHCSAPGALVAHSGALVAHCSGARVESPGRTAQLGSCVVLYRWSSLSRVASHISGGSDLRHSVSISHREVSFPVLSVGSAHTYACL